jgi:hypothetical protein
MLNNGIIRQKLFHDYTESLVTLNFDGAKKNLQQILNSLPDYAKPTNEDMFASYAVHLLRNHVNSEFKAVYTQVGCHLPDEIRKSKRGRPPEADGVLIFKFNEQ